MKIQRKRTIGFVVLLFAIAGLVLIYQYTRKLKDIPGLLMSADTSGAVAAIRYEEDGGARAVVITADGDVLESPGFEPGKIDRDPVWRPDGNALFFSSDREEDALHIYRWNPETGAIERRSVDNRSKTQLNFDPQWNLTSNDNGLIISGGFVLSYEPQTGNMLQVLPPTNRGGGSSEEGAADQFAAAYQQIGNSFTKAQWGPNRDWVIATLRGDEGETLVAQPVRSVNGVPAPPSMLISGESVEFDVSPEGIVAVAVRNFRFRELPGEQIPVSDVAKPDVVNERYQISGKFISRDGETFVLEQGGSRVTVRAAGKLEEELSQYPLNENVRLSGIVIEGQNGNEFLLEIAVVNGVAVRPWSHGVLLFNLVDQAQSGPMGVSLSDDQQFASPRFSPDGKQVALLLGSREESGGFASQGLLLAPAAVGGLRQGIALDQGNIREPSWIPDGSGLLYVKASGATRNIFRIKASGGTPVRVGPEGEFGQPVASPQTAK